MTAYETKKCVICKKDIFVYPNAYPICDMCFDKKDAEGHPLRDK